MYRSLVIKVFILLSLFGLAACQSTDEKEQAMAKLPVDVTYLERKMLPPGATLTVTLEDVSKMDVAAEILDKQSLSLEGAPPYRVILNYDANQIDPRMNYALRARIEHQGKLLFINKQHVPAFNKSETDNSARNILVQSVRHSSHSKAPKIQTIDGNWTLTQLGQQSAADLGSNKLPSVTFNQDKISGLAGCNRYHGSVKTSNQQLTIGPLAMTKMLCQGQAQVIEDRYLEALNKVRHYKVNSASLKLLDSNNDVVMMFTRQ